MTLSNIRDTDLLALSHQAEHAARSGLTAYHLRVFSTEAAAYHLANALKSADEVTAAADRIRDRLAMKDEAVSTNIRIGEEL